jgi:hypothetical protein
VRALRLIACAMLELVGSALSAAALITAVRELTRRQSAFGLWGGTIPITDHKWPWVVLLLVLVLCLFLIARAIGGPRGLIWGAVVWLLRIALWWAAAALLVFLGVVVYGLCTQSISDLNVRFALSYLVVSLAATLIFWQLHRRSARAATPP